MVNNVSFLPACSMFAFSCLSDCCEFAFVFFLSEIPYRFRPLPIHLQYLPQCGFVYNLTILERAGGEINGKKRILLALFVLYFSLSYALETTCIPFTAFSQVGGI